MKYVHMLLRALLLQFYLSISPPTLLM